MISQKFLIILISCGYLVNFVSLGKPIVFTMVDLVDCEIYYKKKKIMSPKL